ncbi:MAG TPA: spiro-SPASM protein [Leptospiraceae bacterium]|nr:spiro-SPASM protein [Leptospiraceae bacterium]HMW07933.1 spiro-SPASM protein [Leptospiraceae bacterium]HMX34472.1 spiro-SPASM protein [Leptospiraceae bacterium]HMY34248.1 spiro-SPASM protein [Leptospiraceae bacterium]HMZ64712.1 spiro-SPASM protein [Leptospiraceae bacterium]
MKPFDFSVSSVAIFLTSEQKHILEISDSSFFIDTFFRKLDLLFPNLPIYSNFRFSNRSNIILIEVNTESDFLFAVTEKLPESISGDADFDETFFAYFIGISPLISIELTQTLVQRHIRYLAQYSYSENLPKGIVPFFVSREFVSTLPEKIPATVHDYLVKNLNNYDVEIFFQEPDLRQYRLDFSLSDPRSLKTSDFFLKKNPDLEYKELLTMILENPNGFRLFPSYIEMEIYRGCDYKCSFCPRQFISNERDGELMSLVFVEKFLKDLESSFPYPLTFCFGGMGEPLLHPDFSSILAAILNYPHTKELILETALYSNLDSLKEGLKLAGENQKKLNLIINLTTLDSNQYKSIYQSELNPNDILEKISHLSSVMSPSNLHVQMIKMKEVEEEIENYFNHFEKKGINVILQKYNRYAGLMPEKRVSDLTPIHREFCWHLNRDVYINSDGNVAICRQDFNHPIGNLNTESIFTIWEKGMRIFTESLKGNHDKTMAPCLNCDEWYTFNA